MIYNKSVGVQVWYIMNLSLLLILSICNCLINTVDALSVAVCDEYFLRCFKLIC